MDDTMKTINHIVAIFLIVMLAFCFPDASAIWAAVVILILLFVRIYPNKSFKIFNLLEIKNELSGINDRLSGLTSVIMNLKINMTQNNVAGESQPKSAAIESGTTKNIRLPNSMPFTATILEGDDKNN